MDAKELSATLKTKLRELSEKPDGWGDIPMIEPADARAILAVLLSDTAEAQQAASPDYREIRRAMCVIGVVGQIDGHDVIRRGSVLDIIEQRAMHAVR